MNDLQDFDVSADLVAERLSESGWRCTRLPEGSWKLVWEGRRYKDSDCPEAVLSFDLEFEVEDDWKLFLLACEWEVLPASVSVSRDRENPDLYRAFLVLDGRKVFSSVGTTRTEAVSRLERRLSGG